MKKYTTLAMVALSALTFVSAQEANINMRIDPRSMGIEMRGGMRVASSSPARPGMPLTMPIDMQMAISIPSTGDPATDNKIQALHEEYLLEFKALQEKYQAKLKIAIGDKKLTGQAAITVGSSSVKLNAPYGNAMMVRGSTTMPRGTTTAPGQTGDMPGRSVTVKLTEDGSVQIDAASGIRGFFNRLFGR